MPITYVTAYLDLKDGCPKTRSHETCFRHFEDLAKTGIPIVAFISQTFADQAKSLESKYESIRCIFIDIEDLEAYKETYKTENLKHPTVASPNKDTKNFMILMNAKIEFVKKAIDANPFNTTHFAWIDFSITYIFQTITQTLQKLKEDSEKEYTPCLFFPGCWEKNIGYPHVYNIIHWRFCGGFFLGDKQSLLNFAERYRTAFPKILEEKKVILWEVNIWAILEQEYGWSPTWYRAGHEDTIINVPTEGFRQSHTM